MRFDAQALGLLGLGVYDLQTQSLAAGATGVYTFRPTDPDTVIVLYEINFASINPGQNWFQLQHVRMGNAYQVWINQDIYRLGVRALTGESASITVVNGQTSQIDFNLLFATFTRPEWVEVRRILSEGVITDAPAFW